jgi:hypothetical protein
MPSAYACSAALPSIGQDYMGRSSASLAGISRDDVGGRCRGCRWRLQPYSRELLERLAALYQTTPAFLIEVNPGNAESVRAIWLVHFVGDTTAVTSIA